MLGLWLSFFATKRELSGFNCISEGGVYIRYNILFCSYIFNEGDRTIDQMVQAARSGKQNIVKGCAASTTSTETELKLINVARASLQELLMDYEDYLRVNDLELWVYNSPKAIQTRKACSAHNDSAYYRAAVKERSAETIANIAITLIHQEDVFLRKILEVLQKNFVENGGIREQMTKARLDYRKKQGE